VRDLGGMECIHVLRRVKNNLGFVIRQYSVKVERNAKFLII
jgi:hypothetical protein